MVRVQSAYSNRVLRNPTHNTICQFSAAGDPSGDRVGPPTADPQRPRRKRRGWWLVVGGWCRSAVACPLEHHSFDGYSDGNSIIKNGFRTGWTGCCMMRVKITPKMVSFWPFGSVRRPSEWGELVLTMPERWALEPFLPLVLCFWIPARAPPGNRWTAFRAHAPSSR